MEKDFTVKVNNSIDFNLKKRQIINLDILKENQSKYHLIYNNKSINVQIIERDFDSKSYKISLNSTVYKIQIEDLLDQLIKQLGFSEGNSKKLNNIKAPMPGIIIGIDVKKGDEVKEGDALIVLEAMKMENAISSPKDARVKTVFVKKGDTVEKNKLLIELE